MSSKKHILVFALAGLIFSCQKEVIRPNDNAATAIDDSSEKPVFRSSATSGNGNIMMNSTEVIKHDKTNVVSNRNSGDSDITDPNNDDDRNKKKKN